MEFNGVLTSSIFNSSTNTAHSTGKPLTTTVVYNKHLFLHTTACKAIAGTFTWTAILITGCHVRNKKK